MRTAHARTTAVALESLGAIGTVRAFGHEAGVTKRIRQCLAQGFQLEQREALAYAAGLWSSGVWGYCGHRGMRNSGMTMGDVLAQGWRQGHMVAGDWPTWECGGIGIGDMGTWQQEVTLDVVAGG